MVQNARRMSGSAKQCHYPLQVGIFKPAVSAKYLGNIPNLTGLLAKESLVRTIDSLRCGPTASRISTSIGRCLLSMPYHIEQRFCLFQIRRIEAFGEPTVGWRQQIARCCVPSLVAPEPGEARAGDPSRYNPSTVGRALEGPHLALGEPG
jgi:hypothetical protein